MTRQEAEERFLDYLESTLNADEREAFDRLLADDPDLRTALEQYSKLMMLEGKLAEASAPAMFDVEAEIMTRLSGAEVRAKPARRWFGWTPAIGVLVAASLAMLVTERSFKDYHDVLRSAGVPAPQLAPEYRVEVLIPNARIEAGTKLTPNLFDRRSFPADQVPDGAILAREMDLLSGKYTREMIPPRMPVLKELISDQPPLSSLNIPPGFRAVTIPVDSRSGVEGFAKPGSRVDTLFTFQDKDGKKKVTTLLRFAKILSAGGATSIDGRVAIQGAVDVTLLVTERDAKRIELARNVGTLSLSLAGGEEQGKVRDEDPASVDLSDITGVRDRPDSEEPAAGYMYMRDPKTGRNVKFKLKSGGRWEKDSAGGDSGYDDPNPSSYPTPYPPTPTATIPHQPPVAESLIDLRIDLTLTNSSILVPGMRVDLWELSGENERRIAQDLRLVALLDGDPLTKTVRLAQRSGTKIPSIHPTSRYFLRLRKL